MSLKFGWCMDGHHDSCTKRAPGPNGGLVCACHCHQEDQP